MHNWKNLENFDDFRRSFGFSIEPSCYVINSVSEYYLADTNGQFKTEKDVSGNFEDKDLILKTWAKYTVSNFEALENAWDLLKMILFNCQVAAS